MNNLKKILLFTVLLAPSLTLTVQAYESDIHVYVMDADYPETVEAGGILDLEVTVAYNFSQAAQLNVWVLDGPWYSYSSEIVLDEYFDVNEKGPKVVSLQVPAPEEAGEYRYSVESGWCELDSTELLPQLGGNQEYNITFTVTPSGSTDTGSEDTTTGGDTTPDEPETTDNSETEDSGIPGFPVVSILSGLILVSSIFLSRSRKPYPAGIYN